MSERVSTSSLLISACSSLVGIGAGELDRLALAQPLHHLRRRHHHEANVAVGVDAARGQPVAQQVGVVGCRVDGGERERIGARRAPPRDDLRQRLHAHRLTGRRGLHVPVKVVGHRDGVAAEPQAQRRNQPLRHTLHAQRAGQSHRRQQMRAIEVPDRQLVAQRCPRRLPRQCHVESIAGKVAAFQCHHQRRGVGEWDVPKVDARQLGRWRRWAHLNSSAVSITPCAISAMVLF